MITNFAAQLVISFLTGMVCAAVTPTKNGWHWSSGTLLAIIVISLYWLTGFFK